MGLIERTRDLLEDIAGEQSVCWLAVALALGIIIYFELPAEPSIWPTLTLIVAAGLLGWRWRQTHNLFCFALIGLFMALGFFAGQLETARHNTRFIERDIGPVSMTGQVIATEPLKTGARLTLDSLDIRRLEPFEEPSRIRISSRSRDAEAIRAGDWVRATVSLSPPSPPAVPGGFDFRRHAYFDGYGATGFSFGSPDVLRTREATNADGIAAHAAALDDVRTALARHVIDVLPGQAGPVAAALLTGHRRAIPNDTADVMRDSGLAHLLAISGLHIGLVAGFVFFAIRAFCALVPKLALNYPIKKWAAVAGLITAFSYMLLAGASVPTQRAFIMTAFVMIAIMIDRRAITLRLVAWAAIAVLLIAPHSLVEPGFQMSFAAVAALVAAYQYLAPWFTRTFPPNASLPMRLTGYLVGVGASTLIAGTATAPFALYHFGQSALYGLPANLIAVPLTGLWVLPAGLLGTLLTPLGLDQPLFAAMGKGIEAILTIADLVASWPGAVARVGTLPSVFLMLVAVGGLLLILPRGRIRLAGCAPIAAAFLIAAFSRPPAILVGQSGNLIALTSGGETIMIEPARAISNFERDLFIRATGGGAINDKPKPYRCDSQGCRWSEGGGTVSVLWHEGALMEDCWDSDLVITIFPLHGRCQAAGRTIDFFDLWRSGALAVTIGDSIRTEQAEAGQGGRPWHRRYTRDQSIISTDE